MTRKKASPWRYLRVGEKIRKGDQFLYYGPTKAGWRAAHQPQVYPVFDWVVPSWYEKRYRRRRKPRA